jgi:hypothetical protein
MTHDEMIRELATNARLAGKSLKSSSHEDRRALITAIADQIADNTGKKVQKQQVTYQMPQIVVQKNMCNQRPGLQEKLHRIARNAKIVQHCGIGCVRIAHCKAAQNEEQEFGKDKNREVYHDKLRGHIAGSHGVFQIVPDRV